MTRHLLMLVLVLVAIVPMTVTSFGQQEITIHYTKMTPYTGMGFSARIVDLASNAEVDRIAIAKIESESLDIVFSSLIEGDVYAIEFYIDLNGNGHYDPPPSDHSWRIAIEGFTGTASLGFTPSAEFIDIAWPPAIDGVIGPDEYRHSMTDPGTGMQVHWQNDDTHLYIGLISPGTGWAAIGFDPERKMQGANIIIAAVDKENLVIEDHYGSSPTAHRQDIEDAIIRAAGTEADGATTIEFVIPLASHDTNDALLTPGETVGIILAYHRNNDAFTTRHSKRSTTQITLDGEESS